MNAKRTHCSKGHELTPENTLTWGGYGRCRTCRRAYELARVTHCPQGHAFTAENTNPASTRRRCLECEQIRKARYRTQATHCPSGHEFTPKNTKILHSGHRSCRECARARSRVAAQQRRRAQPKIAEQVDRRVYFISDDCGHVKIGVADNPQLRLADLQTANATQLRIEAIEPGGVSRERELHARFSTDHLRGEWFRFTPDIALYIDELDYMEC